MSHSNLKTKRRFLPNLLNVTLISDALGRSVKLRVSANALKTVDHRGGLDAFLLKAKDDELSPKARELKRADRQEAGGGGLTPLRLDTSCVMPAHDDRCALSVAKRYSPTSVNCSSSVRCSGEKLSSEISVSTSAPSAARCTDRPSMLSI